MKFCCVLIPLALAAGTVHGASEEILKVATVLKADPKSGKLVRATVTIKPKVVSATAPNTASATTPGAGPAASVVEIIEKTAREYNVDPLLIHAVIQVESAYNVHAVSPMGAEGLMQLIPSTARRFGVRNSFNAEDNIRGGVRYLKFLSQMFNNDLRLTLAAYNAGEGAVSRFNWIPPYPETQNYVYQVAKRYGQARRASVAAAANLEVHPERETIEVVTVEKGPQYAPIEQYVDAEGRLHMRTN